MNAYLMGAFTWARQTALPFLRIALMLVPALLLLAFCAVLPGGAAHFGPTLYAFAFRLLGTDAKGLLEFVRLVLMAPIAVPMLLLGYLLGYFWAPFFLIVLLGFWLLGLAKPMHVG